MKKFKNGEEIKITYDEVLQSAVEKESKIRFPLFIKYQSFY